MQTCTGSANWHAAPEQETDSNVSAQKPDKEVAMTENIADNVVSLKAFQSKKLTVPKSVPNLCV